jgi:hypothetical protein
MSEQDKLPVTLELPASEFVEHEGALLVRCPLNRVWVPLTDYYSENQGALLPLVGNVDYAESTEHWDSVKDEKGEPVLDARGEPIMKKVPKESPVVWKETVRVLAPTATAPEGGTVSVGATDGVGTNDKMS